MKKQFQASHPTYLLFADPTLDAASFIAAYASSFASAFAGGGEMVTDVG